jgi:hypothetical protein
MMAEDPKANVAPLDESGKGDEAGDGYIGTRCDRDRRKRYDLARVMGEYEDRAAFILAACDALADQVLGPRSSEVAR